jgi:hypothetical protein
VCTFADYSRAVEAGPPFVEAPSSYAELLAECGCRVMQRFDVTSDHRKSLRALVEAFENNAALSNTLGKRVVNESRNRRLQQISAIDDGLMIREVFLAIAD